MDKSTREKKSPKYCLVLFEMNVRVILGNFLFLTDFEPRDSYTKNCVVTRGEIACQMIMSYCLIEPRLLLFELFVALF